MARRLSFLCFWCPESYSSRDTNVESGRPGDNRRPGDVRGQGPGVVIGRLHRLRARCGE